jgi:hypothetical protein
VPCSMCQQEAAAHVCVSVARCLTCKDTVCIAHLEAHNAAHKGHGHKVFFLSNQNLAQFAQSAADFDSRSHLPCPTVKTAAPPSNSGPAVLSAAAAQRSPCSPAHCKGGAEAPSASALPLEWRDPVGYFGSSAAAASADTVWAEAYGSRAPWADLAWSGAAAAADQSQVSPLFVGNRSVLGAGAFAGGVW